jgi:NAD-dependent SIR2 family protein deacetylase
MVAHKMTGTEWWDHMEEALSDQTVKLRGMLNKSKRTVFFGGAGTSTESGIPDFRSGDGVFQAIKQFGYEPEVLSITRNSCCSRTRSRTMRIARWRGWNSAGR